MVSRRALVLAAVVVTVLALAAGAASVQNIEEVEETPGGGQSEDRTVDEPGEILPPFIHIPGWVLLVLVALLVVTAAVGLLLMPEERRKFLRRMAIVIVIGMLVLFVADVVDLAFPDFDPGQPGTENATEPENETGDQPSSEGGGDTTNPTTPFVALFVLLGIGVLGVLLLFRVSTGDEAAEPVEADDDGARAAVGRAAGRAADRLEDDSLENAVYQAWHEMTAALEVPNPSTRTPAEFERAAIEAGLEADDVETLTDLFREVRYGEATVTADRERRARDTLRRIEATYAGSVDGTPGADAADAEAESDRNGGTPDADESDSDIPGVGAEDSGGEGP